MHVFMIGAGGVGIGPLALIAKDAGFSVHGSDRENNEIVEELLAKDIPVWIPQSAEKLQKLHEEHPIDWVVYSSGIPEDNPEFIAAKKLGIRMSKRDDFINEIIATKSLRLIAVAGTHGKTTTTGMIVWLFRELGIPISYSVGTQISFGPTGQYDEESKYFIYECDEFDRNFLHYHPFISLITSVDYDHPDTYPNEDNYRQAFVTFAEQSEWVVSWSKDERIFNGSQKTNFSVQNSNDTRLSDIKLSGQHNRQNAWLAIQVVSEITERPILELVEIINRFPGTARRFEYLAENIFTDYAHHPKEIAATLEMAKELSRHVVAVYQPHQNVRQHAIADEYQDCFKEADHVYWVPTYLTREDLDLAELTPQQLVSKLTTTNAETTQLDDSLAEKVKQHAEKGSLVIIMGAGPIDNWARKHFVEESL